MNVEIFIVSCAKHYSWLNYCLKSIEKFATGFSGVTVLVPCGQESDLALITKDIVRPEGFIRHRCGQEWPDKGMLWHMAQILRADEWCPQADFILHTDSDCLFTESVTPEDYFVDGKPVLYYEKFSSITKEHPQVGMWQVVTQDCLPFPVHYETMRRHPAVHPRTTYAKSRQLMESKTRKSVDDYIGSCREGFPQTFCEFNTLGNVAMECFPSEYHLVDMAKFKNAWPPQKLCQFWTHSPPDIPQEPTFRGKPFRCTPAELLEICQPAK